jgi:hypothetical protein
MTWQPFADLAQIWLVVVILGLVGLCVAVGAIVRDCFP